MQTSNSTAIGHQADGETVGGTGQTDGLEFHRSERQRLLIVGNGMAGFGLCDRLDRNGGLAKYQVEIIGEEPRPAYDRVNLSKLFDKSFGGSLELAPSSWYAERNIRMALGRRAIGLDTAAKTVTDNRGAEYVYDQLVLATGSHAWVPPVPGIESEGVFVYRTIDDLERLERYMDGCSGSVGAVIGGGLLGLEAAKILMDRGLQTSVIEMAPRLMPRQLDVEAAEVLQEKVEAIGLNVLLTKRTTSIQRVDSQLKVHFDNHPSLTVDVLIVSAGVRPNDQLAEVAGLEKGQRGGFAINENLQASAPDVFAIGECVSFEDHIYGLVAPCYRMADVLAEQLAGGKETFRGADESAELKLLGVQVATLGRVIGEAPRVRQLTHADKDGYRKLLLEKGRVVGASCVGQWKELPQIRRAIHQQQFLWPSQCSRFLKTGGPWKPGGALSVHEWPGDSVVCSCLNVTKAEIDRTVKDCGGAGVATVSQVSQQCGASTACGSCQNLVAQLADGQAVPVKTVGANAMLIASVLAIVALVPVLCLEPPAFAVSVLDDWRDVDFLWRDEFARQVSGFSLLGITLVGMLFSIRKRFPRLMFGDYASWRAAHGVLGTVSLLAMVVHTGLRLGSNLNFMLAVCFLATIFLGALAGISSSLEGRVSGPAAWRIRKWRSRLSIIHRWVTWPLPALIGLHILGFYWFSD